MASISLYQSEKIRELLTREQQKQIQDIYAKVAEKLAAEAESLAGKDNTSSILRRQWLNDMQKKLNIEIENIGGSVQKTITDTITKAAQAVVDDNIAFFEKHNISMKGAFQNVPDDVVERVATGKLYSTDWTLSKAIWKDIKDKQTDINTVIAEGIAGNKSAYDIAKDLEKYVDPKAKKDWDWSKVYPVANEKWNWTKKTIDYNAQRLARTMVSHAYQQSLMQTVKYNPFVEKIRWRSANAHGRTCQVCADRNGKLYDKSALPLDHPNGLCTFIPEIGSMDDVAERLADWANGKEDSELDKFYENAYQGDIEKISPKALKKPDKSGIINNRELHDYGDKLYEKLGSALENNKDEFYEIEKIVNEKGGEIRIVDERKMVYNARGGGMPGEIIIDIKASIGALKHEFRHFLDDEASGFIGLRVLTDNDLFWKYEFNGYLEELKLAKSFGYTDIAKEILKEMRERKNEIYGK